MYVFRASFEHLSPCLCSPALIYYIYVKIKPEHRILYKISCAPREDADRSVCLHSLISLRTLGYPQNTQQRLRSDCVDAQADLCLR